MGVLTPDSGYDTNVLIQVVPNLKKSSNFLLDRFFPNVAVSDTEYVSIDIDVGIRRMAPFVSPLVEGKLVEQRQIQTNAFKPAYIKDKRAPDVLRPVRRMIGERIGGGGISAGERRMANIMFEMEDQVDMLDRRLEWMASQAMQTGAVTISGDGYPTVSLSFGRNADLTVVLTGGTMWDSNSGAATPVENIEDWQNLILKGSGAVPSDIVFTPTPWYWFTRDQSVRDAMWFPKSGETKIELGAQVQKGAVYKGRWGNYDLWVHNDWYVDANGNEDRMIPDGVVMMCGPDIMMGTRAFGPIIDPKFNYEALPYAPKTWDVEDPAQSLMMMQSSPIVIPSRVNACLAATVTNPNAA